MSTINTPKNPLGKKTSLTSLYNSQVLYPIPRSYNRDKLINSKNNFFHGFDEWNAFEISWLNSRGKPITALGKFIIPADSTHLIESKSLKLYLNSFNNSVFNSANQVQRLISADLSSRLNLQNNNFFKIIITELNNIAYSNLNYNINNFINLDKQDISCDIYDISPELLKLNANQEIITESLYSNLLKSNCLVTNQPDWGTVFINYTGSKINHESLLKYIISYRNHNEFHEHCVERIFTDIMNSCNPNELTVYARYTRRGGLDINPIRSTNINKVINHLNLLNTNLYNRLIRQ